MALILSGTNGLSDVDGSAATPAIRGTDANTGIFFPSADTIGLATGGVSAVTVNSDQSVTFAQGANLPNTFGFKNRIINGAMVIDQRNAGASVTCPAGASYVTDRFVIQGSVASKFTAQQNAGSVTPPAGFINYLGLTSSSAYTPGSSEFYMCQQWVEGLNIADLGWGTANAQAVTVSFWVRSSLTGTFAGSLNNSDYTRSYPFTFSISSANTWTQITKTIAGDQSGTWLTTNGRGIGLHFNMGAGSSMQGTANAWNAGFYISTSGATNVVSTSGATFYITGVQLEKGLTATSFDYRPYGTELALCQRYFQQIVRGTTTNVLGTATWFSATRADGLTFLPTSMRASPSFSVVTGASYYRVYLAGNSYSCSTVGFNGTSADFSKILYFNNTDFSSMTNGSGWWEGQNANSSIGLTAEL